VVASIVVPWMLCAQIAPQVKRHQTAVQHALHVFLARVKVKVGKLLAMTAMLDSIVKVQISTVTPLPQPLVPVAPLVGLRNQVVQNVNHAKQVDTAMLKVPRARPVQQANTAKVKITMARQLMLRPVSSAQLVGSQKSLDKRNVFLASQDSTTMKPNR